MPPVLGALSPSNTRLWSCAEASGIALSPSQSAKNEASSPVRNSSTTTSAPAAPKLAAEHHVDRGFRLGDARRHHHALAGGEPVGLHHDRRTLRPHVGLGGRRRGEALIGRRRDIVGLAQVLGKALGTFELGSRPARAERLNAGGGQIVDDTGAQRRLGTDHHEVDAVANGRTRSPRHGRRYRARQCPLPARCRHCRARNRAARPAGSPRSSRPARARARRSRGGGRS